ncbi:hypothetical protein QAD02_014866 [Eretmocerus hayati]|uniref:Uncharacterized protein n=1 Tax=Eretmocerus hayati TaxID=131215 RepID=A0ACC2P727_9HYME|nr:hypothetical protein QAD02_014866 [Eretmocerus hayati]
MNDVPPHDFCIKSAVQQVLKTAAEEYRKENKFVPQTLLKLRWIFGSTLERALELYENKKVTIFVPESTRAPIKNNSACCFYEVKGQKSEIYTIFPNINFCSCLSFENQVLKDGDNFTCKHILAVCPNFMKFYWVE